MSVSERTARVGSSFLQNLCSSSNHSVSESYRTFLPRLMKQVVITVIFPLRCCVERFHCAWLPLSCPLLPVRAWQVRGWRTRGFPGHPAREDMPESRTFPQAHSQRRERGGHVLDHCPRGSYSSTRCLSSVLGLPLPCPASTSFGGKAARRGTELLSRWQSPKLKQAKSI